MTAEENLKLGTIDRIIQEPPLGAKSDDYAFFTRIRSEIIRATDEVVLKTKSVRGFRSYEVKKKKAEAPEQAPQIDIPWDLNPTETRKLLALRSKKYREMGKDGFGGETLPAENIFKSLQATIEKIYYTFRYDVLKGQQKQVKKVLKEVSGEGSVLVKRLTAPFTSAYDVIRRKETKKIEKTILPLPAAATTSTTNVGQDPL
jgi:acetyl-CoA carboxylase carboxyl transferase subunit beta